MSSYQRTDFESTKDFATSLDEVAKEGARRMLVAVLEREVAEFLDRKRWRRINAPELVEKVIQELNLKMDTRLRLTIKYEESSLLEK